MGYVGRKLPLSWIFYDFGRVFRRFPENFSKVLSDFFLRFPKFFPKVFLRFPNFFLRFQISNHKKPPKKGVPRPLKFEHEKHLLRFPSSKQVWESQRESWLVGFWNVLGSVKPQMPHLDVPGMGLMAEIPNNHLGWLKAYK